MSDIFRILLVDDNPDDLAHMRQMLLCGSNRPYEFTEAVLGSAVLRLIAQQQRKPCNTSADCSGDGEPAIQAQVCASRVDRPFDCILLDFNLPDMNALEVLAELCDGSELPPCPVVVITGWNGADSSDGHKLIKAGAQDFIGKSWTTSASLTRAIENSVERFELQTRRRTVEAKLSESEERYRNLFNSMSDCLFLLEVVPAAAGQPLDFRYIALNPAFAAQTLIPGVLEQTIRQTKSDDADEWLDHYEQVRTTGIAFRQKRHLVIQDRVLDVHAFCMGVPGSQNVAVVFKDITELMRAERQLAMQARALEELDHRKDEFLAMLSHEMRNPLAPLSNAVQLLQLIPDENPVRKQALAIIERQASQLNQLVDELLEISRISTGRVQLKRDQVALSSIVARAIETSQPLFTKKEHALAVTLQGQPVWLYADAKRLEQIVVNLLTNAAKYTDRGGQISLDVHQEGDVAVLHIADNGIGIAPEVLPFIFELFTQAERSLDRSEGGLGIGLCLVQRLVELHGGSVSASSTLGQGSDFVVRLPAIQSAFLSKPTPADTMQVTVQWAEESANALRILVVDDNIDAAKSMMALLQMSDHEVKLAYDGPSALLEASAWLPDVVLLDIGLPGLNGYEVAKRLRQDAELDQIMLIAVTGYGRESDLQNSRSAGFNYHLTKPTDYAELEKLIKSATRRGRGQASSAIP